MQELIKVTANEQGSQVVSARELHKFLEVKTEFAKWCKRMFEYGFEENKDYILVVKNDERVWGGNNKTDFALTLDTAKEISMVQRTDKGKQARLYFIECEKVLKKPLSPAEQLLANAQLLVDIEKKQLEFDSRLTAIEESRNVATQELLLAERSTEKIPEETTRAKIRKLINQYCNAKNADQRSVWHVVYDRLYYRYGVSLRAVLKAKNESMLDVAERLGHLEKIFAICSNELEQ
jgi:phage anti-repressor protein